MKYVPLPDEKSRSLLPIYIVTVGLGHDQETRYRPNGAAFHHVLFVESGEGVFETPTKRITVSAGSAVFINKSTPSTYCTSGGEFKTAWVTFDGKGVDDTLSYFSAEPLSVCKSSSLYPKLLSCANLCRKGAPAEQLSNAAYDMIVSYFTELSAAMRPRPIVKARSFIAENYHRDISVADIAGASGVSQSLIFRLFRETENTTPIELLRRTRIKKARDMLISQPELRIGAIADACGFSDKAYFCMVFKRETGMTPNAFRRAYGA